MVKRELKGYVDADIRIDYVARTIKFKTETKNELLSYYLTMFGYMVIVFAVFLSYLVIEGRNFSALNCLLVILMIPIILTVVSFFHSHPKLQQLMFKFMKRFRKPHRVIKVWNPFKFEVVVGKYLAEIEYYGECADTVETVEWKDSILKFQFSKPSEGYVKIKAW